MIYIAHTETEFRKKSGYKGLLNIWFSDNYRNYVTLNRSSHKEFLYIYDENFVIPVIIRKYSIFRWASLLSEPANWSEGGNYKAFLNFMCDWLKANGCQWLTQTPASAFFDDYPNNAKTILFASYVLDLTKPVEDLYSGFAKKFVSSLKRGIKGNVEIKIGGKELSRDFGIIETDMWKRSNVDINHQNDHFYDDLFGTMSDNVIMGIAYKDNKPQAGLALYSNSYRAYAMLAGRIFKNEPGSNNLLYWRMIEYCKSCGILEFVIVGYRLKVCEGTKLHGIQKFKDDFGGELRKGYMFKCVFKPFFYALYKSASCLRQYVKGNFSYKQPADIIDQELYKWPDFNK